MINKKEIIIDEINKQLTPLKNLYKDEIDIIINDLKHGKYDTLNNFINKHYSSLDYTEQFRQYITNIIKNNHLDNKYLDNFIDKKDISHLKETIVNTQLLYLNDVKTFIKNLEEKNNKELYDTLIDLSDIRFIQHSLSLLNHDKLEKLYTFMDIKLKNKKHSLIDNFIYEAIKKNLHSH